jgi:membrane protease YdiL (CAAX protease family)
MSDLPPPLPVEPEPPRRPAWGWLEVVLCLLLMGPALVAGSILALAGGYLLTGGPPSALQIAIPAQLLSYLIWLAGVWLLFRMKRLSVWREFAFRAEWRQVAPWLASGPFLALGVGLLAALLRAKKIEMEMIRQLLEDPVAFPVFVAFGITLAPLVEELLFRGAILPVAVRSMGTVGALLLTSVPFSLIHGPQYSWSWQHLALLVAVGVVFGWIRLRTGSTLTSTLAHASYNLTMFAGYFIQEHSK